MQGFDKGFLAMFTRVRDQDYCHIPISIYQFDIVCRDCTLGIEGVRVCISMMGVLWISCGLYRAQAQYCISFAGL